jgi:hypothetical protein
VAITGHGAVTGDGGVGRNVMTGIGGGHVSGPSTHDLLLAMAGQVDDDLLAWARELVAVGENTRAIALVTAAVTADRAALPAALRASLVASARAAQTDLDADSALPEAADSMLDHRFAATPSTDDDRVATAVRALPAPLLDGAEVRLAWRLTPAGSAPGPVPHPVVLVEVGPGGRPADVLAYQLSVALDRSGVVASVEVLSSGNALSVYHAAARRAAVSLRGTPPAPAAEPVMDPDADELLQPGHADLWESDGSYGVPSEPAEAAATDATGDVVRDVSQHPVPLRPAPDEAGPRPAPRPLERVRTTVRPLTRPSLPSPGPLARRDGNRLRPLVPVTDETSVDAAADGPATEAPDVRRTARPHGAAYSSLEQGQVPALADTPMFRSMRDPLSGPLHTPLLAPLLDRTPYGEQGAPEEDEDDDPFGFHGISPLAPDHPTPAPTEDRWAGEWASGDWAVSSSDIERPPVGGAAEPDRYESPRHRAFGQAEEPPAPSVAERPAPPYESAAPGVRPADPVVSLPRRPGPGPAPAAEPPRPSPAWAEPVDGGLGLRPESVARLSDADRDLLARLQADLGTGTRPRLSRRAGVAAPNGPAASGPSLNGPAPKGPNGSVPNEGAPNGGGPGRPDPPDLAG